MTSDQGDAGSNVNRDSDSQPGTNGTSMPEAGTRISESLLKKLPTDPDYKMNDFLSHSQASGEQYERPPLGFRQTESQAEVEARMELQLRDLERLINQSNNPTNN